MEEKICCFAGHSQIFNDNRLEKRLCKKCVKLIENCGVSTFWVGNYGDFDHLAARVIRQLKKEYPQIELDLVLPYVTKSINESKERYYKNYDYMIMADMPEKTPTRYRILKCNQFMVDSAAYLIAYVNNSFGGAAKTLEYAQKKKNIEIFNFGTYTE